MKGPKMPRYEVWFLSSFPANLLAGYLARMLEAVERGEVFHFPSEDKANFFLTVVVISLAAGMLLLGIEAPSDARPGIAVWVIFTEIL
jgi:hypothetical protein